MCEDCLKGTVGYLPEGMTIPTHVIRILPSGHYDVKPIYSDNYFIGKKKEIKQWGQLILQRK